ncbi:hypothetical protein JW948_17045 [bacterium]|nr:hypothetical protein [bacterium]
MIKTGFTAGLLFSALLTAGTRDLIESDRLAGKISEPDAVFYETLLFYAPGELPAAYRPVLEEPVDKCGFHVQARLGAVRESLTAAQRDLLDRVLFEPALDLSAVSPRGLFRMHYTDVGTDAVPLDDSDASGVPDFIEEAGLALDLAYEIMIERMGFRIPPADTTDGPEWDAYFRNGGFYGETRPRAGTFSVTPIVSYMNMDNNFSNFYTKGLDGLRVTCAHEFFHVVQLGYAYRDEDVFLMEAAATWMEDRAYDDVNDYIQYMEDMFGSDNMSMTSMSGEHAYGMCLWFHFLTARYGQGIVPSIWEAMTGLPALSANQAALDLFDENLSDEIALFYGWNLMTGSRADTLQFYPEGHLYPEQTVQETVTLSSANTIRKSVLRTAAKYVATPLDGRNIVWAMVNADWESAQTWGDGLLMIRFDGSDPAYYAVSDSLFSILVSEQGYGWRSCVMIDPDDGPPTLQMFPELGESSLGTIHGAAHVVRRERGIYIRETSMPGIFMHCISAGSDSVLNTADDVFYSPCQTDLDGEYHFFGLKEGLYLIGPDLTAMPQKFVMTSDTLTRTVILGPGEEIGNIDFFYSRLVKDALPVCLPNPFIPDQGIELRIPFFLEEPDVAELSVFSSQGALVYHERKYFPNTQVLQFLWNGRNGQGPVPSGIYLYVIVSNKKILRREKFAVIH